MKQSKQFFYQLYSNYDRKFAQSPSLVESFTIHKFQTVQCLLLYSFSKTIQGLFQVSDIQGLFKGGLKFKAGTGLTGTPFDRLVPQAQPHKWLKECTEFRDHSFAIVLSYHAERGTNSFELYDLDL